MSLVLVWNDDAPTYPDCNLRKVVQNVIEAKLDEFQVAQSSLVDAFRLAIASDQIDHTTISLLVQQTSHSFNQYGNFDPHGRWPIPDAGGGIIEDLLMTQSRKKRALKAPQVS